LRALIVSAPTLDEIEFEVERRTVKLPGGPALFAGLALRRVGYEVCCVGPFGLRVKDSICAASRHGGLGSSSIIQHNPVGPRP